MSRGLSPYRSDTRTRAAHAHAVWVVGVGRVRQSAERWPLRWPLTPTAHRHRPTGTAYPPATPSGFCPPQPTYSDRGVTGMHRMCMCMCMCMCGMSPLYRAP